MIEVTVAKWVRRRRRPAFSIFQPLKVHLAVKLAVMMDAAASSSPHMPSLILCRWHIIAAFAGRPI